MKVRHLRLRSCGSTNDEARSLFDAGEVPPVLVSTAEQTAGRGRLGRSWSQLGGNFAGSFLIEATRALLAAPGALSLLSGSAIRDALIEHGADGARLALKWPNDVLLDDRKVAGILSEYLENDRRRAFIVGIGVNLRQAPEQTVFPAATAFGADAPEPAGFGDTLAKHLMNWTRQAEDEGTEFIINAWKRCGWRIGEALAVRQPDWTEEGIFEDLDSRGHLLLRKPDGTLCTITAGDAARR